MRAKGPKGGEQRAFEVSREWQLYRSSLPWLRPWPQRRSYNYFSQSESTHVSVAEAGERQCEVADPPAFKGLPDSSSPSGRQISAPSQDCAMPPGRKREDSDSFAFSDLRFAPCILSYSNMKKRALRKSSRKISVSCRAERAVSKRCWAMFDKGISESDSRVAR